MTKKEIRAMIREKKQALTQEEIRDTSLKLCEIFTQQPFYREAKVIYPYLAYNQEIVTTPLIVRAWMDGKEIAVPKCYEDNRMEFHRITSFEEVALGFKDIPEPKGGEIVEDKEVLILMPGIAFDRDFGRIGYGGGYYDRYLDRKKDCRFTKVAFAYDFQMLDHIDMEPHDYRVDAIITTEGCLYSPALEKTR